MLGLSLPPAKGRSLASLRFRLSEAEAGFEVQDEGLCLCWSLASAHSRFSLHAYRAYCLRRCRQAIALLGTPNVYITLVAPSSQPPPLLIFSDILRDVLEQPRVLRRETPNKLKGLRPVQANDLCYVSARWNHESSAPRGPFLLTETAQLTSTPVIVASQKPQNALLSHHLMPFSALCCPPPSKAMAVPFSCFLCPVAFYLVLLGWPLQHHIFGLPFTGHHPTT
jgi:hypothetical protein